MLLIPKVSILLEQNINVCIKQTNARGSTENWQNKQIMIIANYLGSSICGTSKTVEDKSESVDYA